MELKAKKEIIINHGKNEKDTGNTKVQIALLTQRISYLTEHLKKNKKDYNTRRSLLKMVGKRRRFLNYLKGKDIKEYRDLIKTLEIRK
jgi:small subunit ribosomal protein S15